MHKLSEAEKQFSYHISILVGGIFIFKNQRVTQIRKHLGLTMEKFGGKIGVTKTAISLIESGKNNLTEANIKSICREFNINEQWLRTGDGEMLNKSEDKAATLVLEILELSDDEFYSVMLTLLESYKNMSSDAKAELRQFANELCKNNLLLNKSYSVE